MNIGKVVGSVVCTVKTPSLSGIKLLVVRQIVNGQEKGLLVACDGTRQAEKRRGTACHNSCHKNKRIGRKYPMWTIRLWRSFFPDYTRKKEKTNVCWAFKL